MCAWILCPAIPSIELYSMMRSANFLKMTFFFVSCMSSVASRKAVCSFVFMRLNSSDKNEHKLAGVVGVDKMLSRKSPMISGM